MFDAVYFKTRTDAIEHAKSRKGIVVISETFRSGCGQEFMVMAHWRNEAIREANHKSFVMALRNGVVMIERKK